jgi:hypothetical protein
MAARLSLVTPEVWEGCMLMPTAGNQSFLEVVIDEVQKSATDEGLKQAKRA